MVERSFSLETAVAIAGNFASSGQTVSRPEMRLAGGIEDRHRPVTIELDFEDPIGRIKGSFRALRHHWREEGWEGGLWHFSGLAGGQANSCGITG
jgi:hypothetical protein